MSDTMINRNSAVSNIAIHAHAAVRELDSSTGDADPVGVADQILRKFGPRAITMLTSGRVAAEGRALPARLSANDCYVALDEACRKMARVAIRKFRQDYAPHGREIDESLQEIFPDPAAYLARAIKSVIADSLGLHLDLSQRIQVDPCSLSVIRYTPLRPFLVRMNDTGRTAAGPANGQQPRQGDAAIGGGAGG